MNIKIFYLQQFLEKRKKQDENFLKMRIWLFLVALNIPQIANSCKYFQKVCHNAYRHNNNNNKKVKKYKKQQ